MEQKIKRLEVLSINNLFETGCRGCGARGPAWPWHSKKEQSCPAIPTGPRSSTRKAQSMPSAASCGASSAGPSSSLPATAAATPNMNLETARYAIDKGAKSACPRTTSSRAIKPRHWRASRACTFEEITYEGFGPGGVAMLVDVLTDNRNRTRRRGAQDFRDGRRHTWVRPTAPATCSTARACSGVSRHRPGRGHPYVASFSTPVPTT